MRLVLTPNKEFVQVIHEDAYEYKGLYSFPAFHRDDTGYYIPAKPWILHNVISRLAKNFKNVKASPEVLELSKAGLKLKAIPDTFKYHTTPMVFQEIALRFLYTLGSAGILLDPGMGKTKVILDYIHLMGFERVCVVCPLPLLFVWEDEIAIHRPELTFHSVTTTDWEKEREGLLNNQVTIVNYSKLSILKEQFRTVKYDYMHLDEFLIKDPKTQRTEDITELSRRIPYRSGGSGTLVNNSIMDIFAPVRFLEPSLVGDHPAGFFQHHAVVKEDRATRRKMVVGYKKMEEARSALRSCSIVMTKEEWLKDLPQKAFYDVDVEISSEQYEFYRSLARNMAAVMNGEVIEVDNPLVLLSKLYQVSNGFIYVPEDVEDEKQGLVNNDLEDLLQEKQKTGRKKPKRRTLFFQEQPKIEALRDLITETLPGRRCILWFNMSAEYELISKLLDDMGKKYLTIKGGEKKIRDKVHTFNGDNSYEFLVCQAKSVNYGITILGTTLEDMEDSKVEIMPDISPEVHTQIFYSLNFSLEVFLQQQDRIHRLGQKHLCEYYRLIADTSVEYRIKKAITEKMTLRREVLIDFIKELQNELQDEPSKLV